MNKFITLIRRDSNKVYLNPIMISEIHSIDNSDTVRITMMNGNSYNVIQTIDEIQKLINKSSNITLTTWETGPK